MKNSTCNSTFTYNDHLIQHSLRSMIMVAIASGLSAMIGPFVDGIITGSILGSDAMAAFGYASPIMMFQAAIAGIFANGGTILSSMYLGKGEFKRIRENFTVTIISMVVIGAIFTFLCCCFSEPLAHFLGSGGELLPQTQAYIVGLGLGTIPIMAMQVLLIYLRLDNGEMLCFAGVIAMTVVNIILDLLVALVWDAGLFGMGLATGISYAVATVIALVYFKRSNRMLGFCRPTSFKSEFLAVFTAGIPNAIGRICSSVSGVCMNRLLFACAGTVAVTAYSTQATIGAFSNAIIMGVCSSASIFSGLYYGERNKSALKVAFKVSCKYGLLLSLVLTALFFGFSGSLAHLMLDDNAQALRLTTQAVRLLSISFPIEMLSLILIYHYLFTKKYMLTYVSYLLHNLVLLVGSAFIASAFIGVKGIFLAPLFTGIILFPALLPFLRKYHGKGIEKWLALEDDFIPDNCIILESSIMSNSDEITAFCDHLCLFCEEKSIDGKKRDSLILCVRELATNVMLHGVNHSKKNNILNIDIRVVYSKGSLMLTLMDNGQKFNPTEHKSTSVQHGIQKVKDIAKRIEYRYISKVNSIQVVL